MTLEALDKALAYWEKASQTILANVYELYDHPAYRGLASKLETDASALSGVTAQRAQPALVAVKDLLMLALELESVVKNAVARRADLPMLFQAAPIAAIDRLLNGPSIKLPDTQTPIYKRDLLAQMSQEQSMTPKQLLDFMQPRFESAKDTLFTIDEAWTSLATTLYEYERTLQALEQMAAENGLSGNFDFQDIHACLTKARALIGSDPLGVASDAKGALEKKLQSARERLDALLQKRQAVCKSLSSATDLLEKLREVHALAMAASEEREIKVECAEGERIPRPAADAHVQKIGAWLGKLKAAVDRGEWQPVEIGLENWRETAEETLAVDEQAHSFSQGLLDARKELRGRLEALRAKAANFGCCEDAALGELGRDITELIARRPSPLREIERLLASFQQTLAARTSRLSKRVPDVKL